MSSFHRRDEFVELITKHRSSLFSLIYALVPNMYDAEDIFQQTCVVLWGKFENFQQGTNFLAWACKVARHKVLDWNKANFRKPIILGINLSSSLSELIAAEPEKAVDNQDRLDALAHCLSQLSEPDRILVKRCYGESTKVKELAANLGRSTSSICNSLRRIRHALIKCIKSTLAKESQA